ncbi:major facilitator superfamily domain-containing protein [Phialemonium atrogriseum]|uniref:Major facilitator superfamily domain-containing protein n=1 Tax=Phialemonium atrogriseum TaxID=1093897 RepID=A0AAJ0BRP4_9PEZI|nr:major facilitator superfamily domain-containing protein [Phialemonium atrogriseum]KAK1763253.1 major facilitator superfamily domain-containing protein [Phialemonium atrogriseum]
MGPEVQQTAEEHDSTTSRDDEKQLPAPPDGGSRAWLHVFFCHMVFFNTWGVTNSYGVFQQYYTQTLDSAPSSIAWIGGIQMFLLFFGGVFSGRATDAGYFRHCFFAGVGLQVLGMMLASLASRYYQILLSQGVCVGLGNGLVFTPALSVTSSYFKRRRALAVGISAAGAATGGMVYPATVNSLLLRSEHLGYPWTMRIFGFIMLATYIPPMVGYRPYLPPRSTGPLVDRFAFREKPFVFFTAGMFFAFWGLYMSFFYLGIFARETLHIGDSLNLLIILNGVGVVGRILPGLIGERFTGITNMTILFAIICSLCMYCWSAIHSAPGLYVWVVVNGLFAGGMQALLPTLATRQAPEPDKVGTWTGMVLTTVSFACLTSAPIQGALIQADGGSYLGAQMFSASSIMLAAVCLTLSRWSRVGSVLWVKV